VHLKIDESYFISDITPLDKPALVEHLQEKQIYDQTLAIPYPYTASDAEWWIHHVAEQTREQGQSVTWAIRRQDGFFIGGIGFQELHLGKSHRAELGYWLSKPYWNQGIMTKAVTAISQYAFDQFHLARITAHIFDFNQGSAKVLEKAGFQLEGSLRKHYKKDGRIFDAKLYAKLSPNF